jgi:branched-chain amino acid transport system substrate-binding protein
MQIRPTRRALLRSSLAAGTLAALPRGVSAQTPPIRVAALVPLTGAGGSYGPSMAKAAKAVLDQVNGAGGILGRQIDLIVADDQTNPDAAVRAARQLIDVDKVVAIIGTWASAVTTAVAPLCWESQTFLTTTSGAESITLLPTNGYLIRTQPTTTLQGTKFAQFAVELGGKKVFFISPQTPFYQTEYGAITAVATAAGGQTATLVYDDQKPSYRSEIDTMLRFAPDTVILGGYTPDTTVVLKDLYRAGYNGTKIGFAYAINQKLIDSVPAAVVEGCYTLAPSPAEGSGAYDALVKLIGVPHPDPYTAQVYDQLNLVVLAMAQAGEASGAAIRNTVRQVSQAPGGRVVENALDGLKAIAAKQPIAYQGASGPCKFTERGDITDSKFRYEQIQGGAIKLLKIA